MFIKMKLQDFCCFDELEIDLADQGLVWISGDNLDTDASISNGAGKSTLFKALSWGLYGETIDGKKGDHVIRFGTSKAKVVLTLEGGWEIARTRKKGSMNLKLLKFGDNFDGDRKELQAKIIDIVGLDFVAFKNTILYGQNDIRFASQALKDSGRKEILHKILRVDILKRCHKIVLDRLSEINKVIFENKIKRDAKLQKISDFEKDFKKIEDNKAKWEEDKVYRYDALVREVKAYKKEALTILDEVENRVALKKKEEKLVNRILRMEEVEKEIKPLLAQLSELNYEKIKIQADYKIISNKIVDINQTLEGLSGDECYVCKSSLSGGAAKDYILALEADKEALKVALVLADGDFLQLKKKIESKKEEIEDKEFFVSSIGSLRERRDIARRRIEEMSSVLSRSKEAATIAKQKFRLAKNVLKEENPHNGYLEPIAEKIIKEKKIVSLLQKKLKILNRNKKNLEFWKLGYSGQGLPSFVLDSVMPIITDRANFYLDILSDGTIEIEIRTQRKLKTGKGDLKDEIEIKWKIEGQEGYPPSGGQQRKIEIAVEIALMDVADTCESGVSNLFIADEIFDGLDEEGVSRVVSLLRHIKETRSTVFVVSHRPLMSDFFEKELIIQKIEGISTIKK
jgi:DNA repair exonuclease SbcCD ATPase subunit